MAQKIETPQNARGEPFIVNEARVPHGHGLKYQRIYAKQARKICAEFGATEPEIAAFLEVGVRTITRWKQVYPEFRNALKLGKGVADERVKKALFNRAVGGYYEQEEVHVTKFGDVIRVETSKFIPPESVACIFWLKNRDRENWKDRYDTENTGSVTMVFDDPTQRPDGYRRKPAPLTEALTKGPGVR
jgi:hypothetical protein